MAAVDALIIVAFLAYAIASGLRARKLASRNLEEYFLAGRTLPGWKAGISMAATQFAADTPLLVTGMIATAGVFSLWRLWIYAIAFLLMGLVLGASWRRVGVLTDAELAHLRYGARLGTVLRVTKAVYFGAIFNCTVLAMVLLAATRIAEPFLTWDRWLPAAFFDPVVSFVEWIDVSLTIGGDPATWAVRSANNLLSLAAVLVVTMTYSTTGGLRAVVNTDVVQFAMAVVATLIYAVIVVGAAGGLDRIPGRLEELYGAREAGELLAFTPAGARDVGWAVLGTIAIQWLAQMNADGTGYLAQRTMACRSDADARQAAVIFVVLQVVLRSLVWIAIGLSLLILIPLAGDDVAAREGTFVAGIARWLPAGARGLMLAGMLAALASTLDTHLNWGGAYFTNDLYRVAVRAWRKREPSPRGLVRVARLSNVLILVLALVILTRLSSIESAWKTSLLLGAGMGVPLLLRWFWWRTNAMSELGAIALSIVLAPILYATVEGEGVRLLVMAAATGVAAIVAALFTRSVDDRLVEFYRRARPPGFWGPVAARCGDDPREPARRLAVGLLGTAAGSFGVFCLLVGLGTWLYGARAPSFFPWRAPWIALLLVAGAASVWAMRLTTAGRRRSPRTP